MKNNFNKNSLYTIGVEEEYMLCDSITGELTSKANEIMDLIPSSKKERFSYELLLSEIESNTSICHTANEAVDELLLYRNILNDIGKKLNYSIGISGTHPTSLSKNQLFVNNESYNWVSEQLKYYASRNVTFSTHVHIGIDNSDLAIQITNALRRWIAPLLAISVNSPFFEGEKTGMESSRTFQFSTFPRTNIPSYIKSIDEYYEIIKKYVANKSIEKPRQIWWKIRPHLEHGTIEFRMCDVQRSVRRTKVIISLAQSLVHAIKTADDYSNTDYNLEYLNDSLWQAASKGLNSTLIDPVDKKIISMKDMVRKMIEYCKDSLKYFDNLDIIDDIDDILKNGTESDMQKNVYNKSGFEGLKKYLINKVIYKNKY